MNAKFEEVVIAAWLHDVWKFAQRADEKKSYPDETEYTKSFIAGNKDSFPKEIDTAVVSALASGCHAAKDFESLLILAADNLSCGNDIAAQSPVEKAESCGNQMNALVHLVSTLSIDKRPFNLGYYKMQALEGNAVLCSGGKKVSREDYRKLWKEFENDFAALKGLKYEDFMQALDSLLERYWWCIPSATNDDVDISLYQHAKTTAAFAAALYRWHEATQKLTESDLKNTTEKKFLFVNGDISGIQKYIFDLKTTEDSSKLLRAKSFQLWALSEILSKYIVKKFNLAEANVIMSAGGKFILLLADTPDAEKKLSDIQCEIEEYFIKEFAGHLAVIISDGVEANAENLKKENAQKLFNRIGDTADLCKQKKMQKALEKNGFRLDGNYEQLQENGPCPKCGIFPALENGCECKNCEDLTDIGRKLVYGSRFIIRSDSLDTFGRMLKIPLSEDKGKFCWSVNEFEPGRPVMHVPYVAPKNTSGDIITFEDIAEKSTGNKKLAMFKADIDNLGLVFSSSLGKRMSLSRYADLSKMLHYFFSAYYAWFVENKSDHKGEAYKDKIYTVYSGGDDLCVLGPWDSVMQFALDFKKELDDFTNTNPSITISGGIALSNPKIPVADIAGMAEELLERSKGAEGKNSISVFDTTVSWSKYEELLKEGKWLQEKLEENKKDKDKGVSTGVVYKMIDFSRRAEAVNNGNIQELLHNNLWKSNLKYTVARNVKDKETKGRLLKPAADSKEMQKYRIAVSYALYTHRNNPKEEK